MKMLPHVAEMAERIYLKKSKKSKLLYGKSHVEVSKSSPLLKSLDFMEVEIFFKVELINNVIISMNVVTVGEYNNVKINKDERLFNEFKGSGKEVLYGHSHPMVGENKPGFSDSDLSSKMKDGVNQKSVLKIGDKLYIGDLKNNFTKIEPITYERFDFEISKSIKIKQDEILEEIYNLEDEIYNLEPSSNLLEEKRKLLGFKERKLERINF